MFLKAFSFLALILLAGPIWSATPLFEFAWPQALDSAKTEQSERVGFYGVRVNQEQTFAEDAGHRMLLDLPDGTRFEVERDRRLKHRSGNRSWIGRLAGHSDDYRVLVTVGPKGAAFGHIQTPAGSYALQADARGQWLVDLQRAGKDVLGDPALPDYLVPRTRGKAATALKAAKAGAPSTVDLLIVYSSTLLASYGSLENLRARVDSLIALANTAYADSQISLTLRLAGLEQVVYDDTISNETALYAITGSDGQNNVAIPPALQPVAGWRDLYGADLVLLLRPYRHASSGGCGIAWLSVGRWGGNLVSSPEFGYGIVSDGWDGSYGCGMLTFAHEISHLFGSTHDRITESQPTGSDPYLAFSYAYGYGIANSFCTVMAYTSSFNATRLAKYSNPNIQCAGQACGIAVGQPDEANNAEAIENTRGLVGAYRASVRESSKFFLWSLLLE